MKFATLLHKNKQIPVLVDVDKKQYINLPLAAEKLLDEGRKIETMMDLIHLGEGCIDTVKHIQEAVLTCNNKDDYIISFDSAALLAPIPRPQKNIFCVGKNYAEHAIEMGSEADIPEHVMLFSKAPTSVIGTMHPIPSHQDVTNSLDYEGELAVIIGKTGKAISISSAMDYVFGYTIINDVTARDLQERHKQFLLGKSLDGSCPMGPYIVHQTAVDSPCTLNIETKVNGEVRQSSNTTNFIFGIEEIISSISKGMTLEPGDIIATGTPAGVGKGFNPPKFLASGDLIEITIEGIGTLKNIVE